MQEKEKENEDRERKGGGPGNDNRQLLLMKDRKPIILVKPSWLLAHFARHHRLTPLVLSLPTFFLSLLFCFFLPIFPRSTFSAFFLCILFSPSPTLSSASASFSCRNQFAANQKDRADVLPGESACQVKRKRGT